MSTPKEQPRTCETCNDAFNQDIPCCVPVIGCEDIRAVYRKSGCHHYTPRTDTLEQRYQQLADVARYMWHTLKDVRGPGLVLGMLRGRLLSLGVDVDG